MDILTDVSYILSNLDSKYISIVALSLYVSFIATFLSTIFSIYISSLLTIYDFRGKGLILLIINSLMSLPPVVVGLILYLIFSFLEF